MAWSDEAREAARRARQMRRNTYPAKGKDKLNMRPEFARGLRLLRKGGLSTRERMGQFERGVAHLKRGGPSMATKSAMKQARWNADNLAGRTPGAIRAAKRKAFKAAGRNAVANKNRNP